MVWNPGLYNQFKEERYAPFFDLLPLIQVRRGIRAIDLGCGTGELTKKLAEHLPDSFIVGIDRSADMLAQAQRFQHEKLHFEQGSIERKITTGEQWDLVFSHAAIQWLDDHETLLPALIAAVKPGGQLAIQLPSNHQHLTHELLHALTLQEPYHTAMQGWTRSVSTLPIETYAGIIFNRGGHQINVMEKVYPHIIKDSAALFQWMAGTAMIRYLDKLPVNMHNRFKTDYQQLLSTEFSGQPIFYPFKRILMTAVF